MNEYYCLDIEFPEVNFSSYFRKGKTEVSKTHHAHLYTRQDEIELRIFYDKSSYFDSKLLSWFKEIDGNKFGSFLKVEVTQNYKNEGLKRIDISGAKLCGASSSTSYYEGNKGYVILKIDKIKLYWNTNEENKNTAEFYLDDKGFRVVKAFYSVFGPKTSSENDWKLEISRMNDSHEFYELGKSLFRPEFSFSSSDNENGRVATIHKEPIIQFKYQDDITEEEAILYGDVVLMLASFYYHIKIDYKFRRINLSENTITIKNIEEKNYYDTNENLCEFGSYLNFNEFLQKHWQEGTLENYELLSKAISLFNQSYLVDSSSAFLIRYNIIEICDKQKRGNGNFTYMLNKKQIQAKQEEALDILLGMIKPDEHEEFKTRWGNIQSSLKNKPMKDQLVSFLKSQNLNLLTFPVKVEDLRKMRNNITHGSINKVVPAQLRKANILLCRISVILILNLMGIKDWKLDTEIK